MRIIHEKSQALASRKQPEKRIASEELSKKSIPVTREDAYFVVITFQYSHLAFCSMQWNAPMATEEWPGCKLTG